MISHKRPGLSTFQFEIWPDWARIMPVNRNSFCLLVTLFVLGATLATFGQGTAFMYQGRLNDGGSPANGNYDFRFALYDAFVNGNAISQPRTNLDVPVASGIFITNIDFGPVFTGTNYWLSIGVRTNGAANNTNTFILLSPRQPLLPVPYAIFANTASNLLGALSATQLVGTLPAAQLFRDLPRVCELRQRDQPVRREVLRGWRQPDQFERLGGGVRHGGRCASLDQCRAIVYKPDFHRYEHLHRPQPVSELQQCVCWKVYRGWRQPDQFERLGGGFRHGG